MKRNLALLLCGLGFVVSGCKHHVAYRLTETDRWGGQMIAGVLFVKPFADSSPAITNKQERVGKETWRFNYRSGYAKTNLNDELTSAIVKHLSHSGLFTKVTSKADMNFDWSLSGTLTEFKTRARVNDKAETIQTVTAGFGLLGAIIGSASTAKMNSDIQTSVKIEPVTLSDKTGRIVWQDAISVATNRTVNFGEANEYAVFYHTDAALKQAVNEIIRRIASSPATNLHNADNR